MTEWIIHVVGKRRKEVDKHLLVQTVLILGRQLQEQADASTVAAATAGEEVAADEPKSN